MKYSLLLVLTLTCNYMQGQIESHGVNDSIYVLCTRCDSLYNILCSNENVVFSDPQCLPIFPGGVTEFMFFLRKHVQYPQENRDLCIQGRVGVRFIIDESGKIICPYVYKSLHPILDREALRVVKLMPDWKPASNNGVPCKACYSVSIVFKK